MDETPVLSDWSDEALRQTHSIAMRMVADINVSIGSLMSLRNRQADWGRAAWDEMERRQTTSIVRKEPTMPDLAKIAYEAYGNARGWVVFDGSPMPRWDDQSQELKDAWDAAAQAVALTMTNG